jgi:hypothetical protein
MHPKINFALATNLQSIGTSTAFENAKFTPPEGVFFEENYLPTNASEVGLENSSTDYFTGIYQVTINAPKDTFKREALEAAQVVAEAFKRGVVLEYDGVAVRCHRVQQGVGFYSGDRYLIPVSVEWGALVK